MLCDAFYCYCLAALNDRLAMARTKQSALAAWLLRNTQAAPPPPKKMKPASPRLPFHFFLGSIQQGKKPNREVLVMNTKQQAVWTTEKLIGKDVWLEWEAFQITRADKLRKIYIF